MREFPELADVRDAWRNQPEEIPVDVEQIHERRTWELFATTRSEILSSIGAALFFAVVMAWRFAPEGGRVVEFGCIAVAVWAAVTISRFRDSIRRNSPDAGTIARTGVEYYVSELARRRDHLRSAWIWHGPLWLALIVSVATFAHRIVPGRLWGALPLFLLLAGWAGMGIHRRRRQAAELQREIDEHLERS